MSQEGYHAKQVCQGSVALTTSGTEATWRILIFSSQSRCNSETTS
jgi:hypothetical protein